MIERQTDRMADGDKDRLRGTTSYPDLERVRDRQTKTERQRETHPQTDRDRQTDRQRDTQREGGEGRERKREGVRQGG